MNKGLKIMILACILMQAASMIKNATDGNWIASMWVLSSMMLFLLLCRSYTYFQEVVSAKNKLRDENARLRKQLAFCDDIIEGMEPCDSLKVAEAKQEAYLANCAHLLKRCEYYRKENKRLHILNKNLIENRTTGVKNHAKHKK